MRDGGRVGSKLCALDHHRLCDNESPAVRRIFELAQQAFRNRNGNPSERGQPTEHRDGNCGQIADRYKPLLRRSSADGSRFRGHDFRLAVHGAAPFASNYAVLVVRR
jgi:hypothetical protein